MTQKLAVAIIHGAGTPEETFAQDIIGEIRQKFTRRLSKEIANPGEQLLFFPVFWSSVFEKEEKELWSRLKKGGRLDYSRLRRFTIEFLADAIAYQPAQNRDHNYDKVHTVLAKSLRLLAEQAGYKAPLCVISHSLGSVIATNYIYDLQFKHSRIGSMTREANHNTPLENGETLTLLYTLGSPLALWSLRFSDFGNAIRIPSPSLDKYYPRLNGEWFNFYDRDDVLGYPLKTLNKAYAASVTKDIEVNAGGVLTSWNPFSHGKYMREAEVINPIVDGLVKTWREVN